MFSRYSRILHCVAVGFLMVGLGCSHSSETAGRDKLTADVGKYPAPPAGISRVRVGVPPFKVTATDWSGADLNALAADQMTTLLDQTDRFTVIERAQLQTLIDEQNLEGIVTSGELAKQAQVRGVDFLLLGKVTDLRVKRESKGNDVGLGQIGGFVPGPGGYIAGGAAVSNKSVDIKTECGVDIRLVNPTTGELLVSNFSEYSRTDSADSMGVTILGANTQSDANIQLSEDDKGKVLRLALDDAIRKCLPKIDRFLVSKVVTPAPVTEAPAPAAPAAPASAPAAANAGMKYCPDCGAANELDSKFCAKCGRKLN